MTQQHQHVVADGVGHHDCHLRAIGGIVAYYEVDLGACPQVCANSRFGDGFSGKNRDCGPGAAGREIREFSSVALLQL
ncbi:hypothetical protein ACIQZB_42185 [Streptomyces sp. NPDC097727]|uniref:hypothetical protein n=1 Tax=Streptomyces sp. NPDC097727 TaxID=3366092 RepID=UPI0037FBBD42